VRTRTIPMSMVMPPSVERIASSVHRLLTLEDEILVGIMRAGGLVMTRSNDKSPNFSGTCHIAGSRWMAFEGRVLIAAWPTTERGGRRRRCQHRRRLLRSTSTFLTSDGPSAPRVACRLNTVFGLMPGASFGLPQRRRVAAFRGNKGICDWPAPVPIGPSPWLCRRRRNQKKCWGAL
jgi:hypothetical protein